MNKIYYALLLIILQTTYIKCTKTETKYKGKGSSETDHWYSSKGQTTKRSPSDLAVEMLVKKYCKDPKYTQKIHMTTYKDKDKEKAIQIINAQRAHEEIELNLH